MIKANAPVLYNVLAAFIIQIVSYCPNRNIIKCSFLFSLLIIQNMCDSSVYKTSVALFLFYENSIVVHFIQWKFNVNINIIRIDIFCFVHRHFVFGEGNFDGAFLHVLTLHMGNDGKSFSKYHFMVFFFLTSVRKL